MRALHVLMVFGLSLAASGTGYALTANLVPIYGKANTDDGTNWIVTSTNGSDNMNAARFSGINLQRRGILEYSLAGIPAGSTITGTSMSMTATLLSNPTFGQFEFHGYTGNGTVDLADATMPFNAIGTSPLITALTGYNVPISTNYLQSLVNSSAGYLGMMVYQKTLNANSSFAVSYLSSPVLTVTYVPEPSVLALCGVGGLMLVGRRRRGR